MLANEIRYLSSDELDSVAGGADVPGYVYCHYPKEGLYSAGAGCPTEPPNVNDLIEAFHRGIQQGLNKGPQRQ